MSVEQSAPGRSRIVVGVDGSEPAKQALRWARFLAHGMGSTLEAVAAWQPFTAYAYGYGSEFAAMPRDWDPAVDARKVIVDTLDEVFGGQPPPLEITVRQGNAAKVLLELGADARMLVVGSRGHGGFTGLLLGSVSAACAEHATCPVLVVHGETPPPPT